MGELSNINQNGFGSAAFHAFPDMLADDPYSGDYGSGFWGFAVDTATYVVDDRALGFLCFGGALQESRGEVRVTPLDVARSRVYLAPLGLWITLDAGRIRQVEFNPHSGVVRLRLDAASEITPTAYLRLQQPAVIAGVGQYQPVETFESERGAWAVPLQPHPVEIELKAVSKTTLHSDE